MVFCISAVVDFYSGLCVKGSLTKVRESRVSEDLELETAHEGGLATFFFLCLSYFIQYSSLQVHPFT